MPTDEVRARAVVRGRVQMVGFRAFVAQHAGDAGLRGTVRNASDGTLVCELQGSRPSVERVISVLQRGPSHARVDRVDVEYLEPSPNMPQMRVSA